MRVESRLTILGLLCIASFASQSAIAAAEKWNLNRQTMNGSCHVQLETSRPQLGELLSKHDNQKAACVEAQKLKTDDPSDTKKCYSYTNGARDDCKKLGVVLIQ